MWRWLAAALIALCFAGLVPGGAAAQSLDAIAEVAVEGTQRIEPDTVRSYLLLKPGDPFDPERMDRSLKALFATGLFADVGLQRQGSQLLVRVVENPIINRIAFEGNRRVTTETLLNETQLRPRVVYSRTKVQNDVKRLLDLYRRQGRFAAVVEPKIIQLEQNRVDLVFEINEGSLTGIKRISFVGNKQFSEPTLLGQLLTKETAWYRFFNYDDTYDPDRLTFDRELLRRWYLKHGYADFRVISAVAELAPDRSGFYVTFTVEEGERYKFGKIDVKTALKDLVADPLRTDVVVKEGDWYDGDAVEETIRQMTDHVGTLGYAFVDIQSELNRSREALTVDVTFVVREGPKVYVERIDIVGNVRTLDKVVRREFRLVEGDAFNTSKMQRSRQRIRNLGFFNKVDVANQPGSSPDKTVVKVEIEEKSTGELSFGAGYSTSDKILGNVQVRERNLLGTGQDLRIATTLSFTRREVNASFTEPYFFNKDVSAGVDAIYSTQDLQSVSQYDQRTAGFGLRGGFLLSEPLRQTVHYNLSSVFITNVAGSASPFIREQIGHTITSLIGNEFAYDKRDDRNNPTQGYYIRFGTDFAGLGGDSRFVRPIIKGGYFYPFGSDIVASLLGETGDVIALGQRVRINDRFFIGGDNLRGFRSGGVGPRDTNTQDSLGGTKYYAGSLEVSVPLGTPKDFPVSGRVFTDFGSLWDLGETGPGLADISSLRVSAGAGVTVISPLGPIRIDLGIPVVRENFDRKELIRFSFGTRF
ncbi:MAG: outer membrane protein assembly factor BamA [Proteobacteria bacterium]|nr:outer membrane protein assembly factor BamA [Pseudomonadota bacterium]MBI3496886.1 outer membrane protein assembly factor BamA [Pseudomonadota bacterium]